MRDHNSYSRSHFKPKPILVPMVTISEGEINLKPTVHKWSIKATSGYIHPLMVIVLRLCSLVINILSYHLQINLARLNQHIIRSRFHWRGLLKIELKLLSLYEIECIIKMLDLISKWALEEKIRNEVLIITTQDILLKVHESSSYTNYLRWDNSFFKQPPTSKKMHLEKKINSKHVSSKGTSIPLKNYLLSF